MDNNKDGEESEDFKARSYQEELFRCARDKNSILVLGTGSGKTFISILLIKELAHQIRGSTSDGYKRTVFVVNTVPLVHQQAKAIADHTDLTIGKYEGSMGVDYWTDEQWCKEIEEHEVIVLVAQIFYDLILHARLRLSSVNLLIMDECHHATGNHPMREIMREYECLKTTKPESLPRVMGLTACVIQKKIKRHEVMASMKNLEAAMDCALVTSVDPATVLKFTTGPKEKVICYRNDEKSEYQKAVEAQLVGLQEDMSLEQKNEKAHKQVKKKILNIKHIMRTLGDWCVARAVKYEMENLEELEQIEEDQEVLEMLRLLRQRLNDIYNACAKHETNLGNPLNHISHKVKRFLEILRQCDENSYGLIFVERRNTAKILYDLLLELNKSEPTYSFVRPSYVISCNTRPGLDLHLAELELRKQKETLDKFRSGIYNFVISTSLLEEGVDIRKCNVVLRFDLPLNYRGYVQSRGRARAKPSLYLLMTEEGDYKVLLDSIQVYWEIEYALQKLCHDRALPTHVETSAHFAVDEYIPPYQPYGPDGPKITANSAISLINVYCGKLPADKFTDNTPEVKNVNADGWCTAGIQLPLMAPIKEMVYGDKYENQSLAKKSAALCLCKKLHLMGELNSHLRPKENSDESLLEGLVELPPDEPPVTGQAETGTRKRKRVYDKTVCKAFCHEPADDGVYCLYALDIEPVQEARGSIFLGSSKNGVKMGLMCKAGLVCCPSPLYFSKWGQVVASVREVGPLTDLDPELKLKIEKFHNLVLDNLYGVDNSVMEFHPQASGHDVYILPLDDFDVLHVEILSEIASYTSLRPTTLIELNSQSSIDFHREKFEDALVFPLYGDKSDQMYFVSNILDNLHPCDPFPESKKDYSSYKDYFFKEYERKVKNDDQPMLEVKHVPKELNYLKVCQLASENTNKKIPHFVPELCGVMPIKASLWWQIMCIPSVLHRINCLNNMADFNKNIFPSLIIKEEKIDFMWTEKFLKNVYPDDPVSVQESSRDFIHPAWLMQAFTLKGANDNFNLERLELLGDSFLKYKTGEALFLQNDCDHEGRLSMKRGKLVCNKTLYGLACQKKIPGLIYAKSLIPKENGFLPGYVKCDIHKQQNISSSEYMGTSDFESDGGTSEKNTLRGWTSHEINDKSVADCVEAIIGTYLMVGGGELATRFLDWLGVGSFKGKSLLTCPKEIKTACMKADALDEVERMYKKATLDRLENKIGYKFQDRSFIVQAVRHTSYIGVKITDCYQRLEFLGDGVLDYLATLYIFSRYKDYSPGQLSDLRSYFVKNETLASVAAKLGLYKHLQYSNPKLQTSIDKFLSITKDPMSDELNTEDDVEECEEVEVPKALGDLVESVIGAVYLDSGCSLKETWKVVKKLLGDLLKTNIETIEINPVRKLMEEVTGEQMVTFKKIPYKEDESSKYEVTVLGYGTYRGEGKNFRVAKLAAAKKALKGIHEKQALQATQSFY